MSTQLGKLFGIEGSSGEFFDRIAYIVRHLDEASGTTLIVGLSAIVLLLVGERLAPRLPWSLIVVFLAIVLMSASNLEDRGVAVTGPIPSGLPSPSIPSVSVGDLRDLFPIAVAIFMIAYVEGMGAVQTFAKVHGYRADANQELLALGACNAACGLLQAFPTGGSLSRSAVNDSSGAKTPLASLGTGVIVGVVALFLTGLFENLPETVLGAVVIVAVKGLINVPAFGRLRSISPNEFWIALTAMFGVLLFGMLQGVLIGAIISIILLVWHVSRPATALLGRVPNSSSFSNMARHPENQPIPGAIVFRVDGILFYANVPQVADELRDVVARQEIPPQVIIFDLSTSPNIDLATADMLIDLHEEMRQRGITLKLAQPDGPVRDVLRRVDTTRRFGTLSPNMSIDAVVADWQRSRSSTMSTIA
jgi:MFS superfamily sulfate permease-like transporter